VKLIHEISREKKSSFNLKMGFLFQEIYLESPLALQTVPLAVLPDKGKLIKVDFFFK